MRHLDKSVFVPEAPDIALLRVAASVAGLRSTTAHRGESGATIVRESWRPTWTLLAAVFLFPFGLLALLYKCEATLVVSAVPAEGGAQVRVEGRGHETVCDRVLEALSAENLITY